MNQGVTSEVAKNVKNLGGKAWTAYVSTILVGAFLLIIALPLLLAPGSRMFGLFLMIASVLGATYRVLLLRSYNLYYDDVGIWLYSGVLPWKKGIAGVKWRDLDEVVYFQTLSSWLSNSFSVKVGHRFTKSSELFITHLGRGKDCVIALNSHHQELIRNNALN
jgi:hypothetical protein